MPYRIRCAKHDVYVAETDAFSVLPEGAQVFTSSDDAERRKDEFAKGLGPVGLFDLRVQYFLAHDSKDGP